MPRAADFSRGTGSRWELDLRVRASHTGLKLSLAAWCQISFIWRVESLDQGATSLPLLTGAWVPSQEVMERR